MSNITLPYSVNAINGHSGAMTRGTYQFTTTINLYKAQPTYLWFQHADQSADIYVDDVKVTTHWGGYNAFFTDITNYVHAGVNNIKVALCNTIRNELAPSAGDFNFNATLGKVKVLTSPVLPSMDYGYDGFHIFASNVSSSAATLTIKTNVPAGATLLCKIDDTVNNSTVNKYYEKKPSTGNEVTFTTTISNPTLWDGVNNPHLYNVTLEIYKNGDLYHRFQRGYGIRTYEYVINQPGYVENENYTGFVLNGHPYKLRGVCMHHDIDGKANALSDADIANDFSIIQELGCNFIRLAHYPHPKEVYDWCDRLGIVVQTEVPCVNRFNSPEVSGTNCPQVYYDHLDIQYTEMVRQHFNHPCIMFWGLFNEATTNDSSWAKTKLEYYKTLIKNIDPERWVGYVVPQGTSNPSSTYGGPDMDWFGCNIYVGWYTNNGQTNGELLNNPSYQINTRVNNIINTLHKPLAYSEYGCGGTSTCHSDNFTETTDRGNNPRHDIEYMMWLHEGHIAAIKTFPQLLFSSQWQLFDIAVYNRQEGYKECLDGETVTDNNNLKYLNNKGLVERDHQTKKDTFYLYKAWWNPTPFVHICQKNYEKVDNRVIKCYTNDGDTLTLYVNNTEIETVNVTNNIATFTARNFSNNDVIRVAGDTTNDSYTIRVHDYSQDYLTFNIKSDGNIYWKKSNSSVLSKTISYSKNDGNWTGISSTSEGVAISVTAGDKVRFKGNNSTYGQSITYYNFLSTTCQFDICGNIMSLINGDNFVNNTTLESSYTFIYFFYGNTGLKSVKNLILPATTLTSSCYEYMFSGCTSLTTVPVLPATTLASSCYGYMFSLCTNLTTAPVLSATTLASSCYYHMFDSCTRLTTPPVLPATTLASTCYASMFANCTSLTTAPELPATTLAIDSYYSMFLGCTRLTTAPILPATTLNTGCYGQMFQNCTSLTTAPALPATTLVYECYYHMFYGCSSLNYINCMATSGFNTTNCLTSWVYNVAATGTFVKADNITGWTLNSVDGIPTGWVAYDNGNYNSPLTFTALEDGTFSFSTNNLQYSVDNGTTWSTLTAGNSTPTVTTGNKIMFKQTELTPLSSYGIGTFSSTGRFNVSGNIMSLYYGDNFIKQESLSGKDYAFINLFKNCTNLVDVENLILQATTLSNCCYENMFFGCSNIETTPILPATTLANSCYLSMFRDCTSLTTVSELPATTLEGYCYASMFRGCTSLTTAPDLPATTLLGSSYSNMFNGCTNLNYIKCLATDISASSCTNSWVNGVAATGTFVKNSIMTGWPIDSQSGIPNGWTTENDYSQNYLTFTALEDGTFSFTTNNLQYSVDNGSTWSTLTAGSSTPTVTTGNSILFKQTGLTSNSTYGIGTFSSTGRFNVSGNVMSLHLGDNFINKTDLIGKNYAFYRLFRNCTKLINVENLILPATTLASSCYSYMFFGCTGLTTTPTLPATTLVSACYNHMFSGCTSLTTAPSLPVTTLASSCYEYMFSGCTSLTTAPVLPATTLASYCYSSMFSGCTGLTTAPVLPATTLVSGCYSSMLEGCTSLTTAPALPVTTLADNCYASMFRGCTSLTTTPLLPATTLATYCYSYMFYGCTGITSAPALPATTLSTYCYSYMFYGCTGITTAPELPATTLTTYCYYQMFYGCSSLNYIKCMARNKSATDCITNWVYGVSSTGTFVKHPNMTGWTTGTSGIPSGWTVEDDYSKIYLTFTALENTTFSFSRNNLQYSTNNGSSWSTLTKNTSTPTITTGNKILFKETLRPGSSHVGIGTFSSTGNFNVSGNIMSLICGDDYANKTDLNISGVSDGAFASLFADCRKLINAENLVLPSASVKIQGISISSNYYCYFDMFRNCSSLTAVPNLSQIELSTGCYIGMFSGCTSLTTAPALPATTLSYDCYRGMFDGCTSLTTAPELPATTLTSYCYHSMFEGCTGLTTAPALPATELASYCYYNMFYGCTSLINAPETLPATSLYGNVYYGMFEGCTSLTTSPIILARGSNSNSYERMFYGCSSLNHITCLSTNLWGTDCTKDWVYGVAATGTFVKNIDMSSWTTGTSGIPTGWTVKDYYTNKYLTFDIKSSGNIVWKRINSSTTEKTISYSINDGSWTDLTSTTAGATIPVETGDLVRFKGSNDGYGGSYNRSNSFGGSTATFDVYGNIMSLTDGDDFVNTTSLSKDDTFTDLFRNCTGILNAANLILPATTLDIKNSQYCSCYENMFYGCTSLTTAPELPATTLGVSCYTYMFYGCTSLTTVPELPATTLAQNCYVGMFYGCTSLTTAPVISATTLTYYCCQYMFQGCTSLTTAPSLPVTTLAHYCYANMFYGCTGLTTAPALPATTLATGCYSSMFYGCTSLTTAPELPATTLLGSCYNSMFYGCTGLTTAPALPATTLADYCYYQMFRNCTSLTTTPDLPAATLTTYCYAFMFNGCSSLNYIKCLATDISASSCTTSWVNGVAATGTFVKHPNMTGWTTGTSGIPSGWTVEDDYSLSYLTFTALEDSTFSFTTNNLQYSVDNGSNWTTLTAGSSTPTVTTGNSILFKQTGLTPNGDPGIGTFSSTGNFNVSGNIMSLYYGDDFVSQTSLSYKNFAFSRLFINCNKLVNAQNLILPATTLSQGCYEEMFYNCTSLTSVPALPATTLLNGCYNSMFWGCTSLTTAPALPAMILYPGCYAFMFRACTSLITTPTLPALTLDSQCYRSMFQGCTSLTTAPALPATTLDYECYAAMFQNCTSLTTAPVLPATSLDDECYITMFSGCTSLTTAPELPAKTLVNDCYSYMFSGCSNLNYIKCLATDISATDCTKNWVSGVAASGTFFKATNMSSWTTGISGIPSGWTVTDFKDQYLTFVMLEDGGEVETLCDDILLSTDGQTWVSESVSGLHTGDKVYAKGSFYYVGTESAFNCNVDFNLEGNIMSIYDATGFRTRTTFTNSSDNFAYLFKETDVVSAENLVLPVTSLTDGCYSEMFSGCTSLTTAPAVLPATTLGESCYTAMFSGCTSLTTAPVLPATSLADYCYYDMFHGCTSLTTAPALPATTLYPNCYDSMFSGCTSLTTAPALNSYYLDVYCYNYMFSDCTSLTTAPELPADMLYEGSYYGMFYGCTSLNYVKCLATDISEDDCTTDWLNDVASEGTFVKNEYMEDWMEDDPSGIPSGWTVEDDE